MLRIPQVQQFTLVMQLLISALATVAWHALLYLEGFHGLQNALCTRRRDYFKMFEDVQDEGRMIF